MKNGNVCNGSLQITKEGLQNFLCLIHSRTYLVLRVRKYEVKSLRRESGIVAFPASLQCFAFAIQMSVSFHMITGVLLRHTSNCSHCLLAFCFLLSTSSSLRIQMVSAHACFYFHFSTTCSDVNGSYFARPPMF